MAVARLHATGDVRVADEPVPVPRVGESLGRVEAVGVCGSDLHSFGEGGIGDAMLAAPLVLGHVHLGDDVAVIGCGPIGLLLVQVARAAGARVVLAVDPLAHRRAAAERAGAARALSPEEVPGGVDADVTFEVAGTDAAVELAIRAGRPGARVVLAGIPGDDRTSFPAGAARRKGLTLVLVRRMGDPYPRAIRLVQEGRVALDWLVTDRFPLARAGEAFAAAAVRDGLKVMVEPGRG